MNPSNTSLTKICKSCGKQKPLSAFLQLSGPEGTTYGNICASCRKTYKEKAPEREGSMTSTSAEKIDAKSKVQTEVDKREARKQLEEEYFEERDKRSEARIKSVQKTDFIQQEKKHRASLFDAQPEAKPKEMDTRPVFGGEDQKRKEGEFDLKGPYQDTYIAGKMKHSGEIFSRFKDWLGSGRLGFKEPPIVTAAKRAAKEGKNPPAEGKPAEKKEMTPLNEIVTKKRP